MVKIKKKAKLPIPKKKPSSQATTVGKKRKTNVEVVDVEMFDEMEPVVSEAKVDNLVQYLSRILLLLWRKGRLRPMSMINS